MTLPATAFGRAPEEAAPPAAKGRIRQAQETLILRAAERVFARHGFSGATVADIAAAAAVPKSTVHYYFGTKVALHRAVLDDILALWLEGLEAIQAQADPAEALRSCVRHKMRLVAERPEASRVFANELLHGAPQIGTVLRGSLRALVREKAAVVDGWIAAGRIAPLDSTHLFFTLWALTQTYADFEAQVAAVLDAPAPLPLREQRRALAHVEQAMLRLCGLAG